MVVSGTVEHIIFRSEDSGYTVMEFYADGEMLTAVGIFPFVCEGESLTLVGEFNNRSKFGEQFEVTEVRFDAPTDKSGIIQYLCSGLFRGIGPVTAQSIVDKFGLDTLNVIEHTPEKLAEVKKISRTKAMEIGDSFKEHAEMQNTIIFLQKHGIPMGQAMKIYSAYQESTIEKITENPYRLVDDVEGVGFLTADRIAEKLGIDGNSDFRVMAGISYTLQEAAGRNGHTALPEAELIKSAKEILKLDDEDRVVDCMPKMLFNNKLSFYSERNEAGELITRYYALPINYNTENAVSVRMLRLIAGASVIELDLDKAISDYEEKNGIFLHEAQKQAIVTAVNGGAMIITGGPGTGKTTIIKCIVELLTAQKLKVKLAAPTGRAAKRMSIATGCDASTIHRMLGMEYSDGVPTFRHNELEPMDADVVIVDEISMADIFIFNALLKSLRDGARLILVGDKDQLPSVSAGNILGDLIESGVMPVIYLTEIYRQDAGSLIISNAHRINNGEMPEIDNRSKDFFVDNKSEPRDILEAAISMYVERVPRHFGLKQSEIQILAPMKKGVAGVENLNKEIQRILNPHGKETIVKDTRFRVGDKVMHIVNDYDIKWTRHTGYAEEGTGVFNGDIGYIKWIESGSITVEYDDGKTVIYENEKREELALAYAVSVHKSQGSEFPAVILVLTGGAYMLLNRNLLYTAVTRAKNMVVIVGAQGSIAQMVKNDYTAKRYTLLKELLWENRRKLKML